jgi:hypothetical protein
MSQPPFGCNSQQQVGIDGRWVAVDARLDPYPYRSFTAPHGQCGCVLQLLFSSLCSATGWAASAMQQQVTYARSCSGSSIHPLISIATVVFIKAQPAVLTTHYY